MAVARVHRVPGPGDVGGLERRGGQVDQFQSDGRLPPDGRHLRQPVRAEEPAGPVRRDRRALGRPGGGRGAPQGHIVVDRRPREAQMVPGSAGQPRETARGQPVTASPATRIPSSVILPRPGSC